MIEAKDHLSFHLKGFFMNVVASWFARSSFLFGLHKMRLKKSTRCFPIVCGGIQENLRGDQEEERGEEGEKETDARARSR